MHIVRVADKHIEIYDESTQTVKFRLDFDDYGGSIKAYRTAVWACDEYDRHCIPLLYPGMNDDSISAYDLAQNMCEELNQNRKG